MDKIFKVLATLFGAAVVIISLLWVSIPKFGDQWSVHQVVQPRTIHAAFRKNQNFQVPSFKRSQRKSNRKQKLAEFAKQSSITTNYGGPISSCAFDNPVDNLLPAVRSYIIPFNDTIISSNRQVFVIAFDKSHYREGSGVIKNLREAPGQNFSIVFYDLGLLDEQAILVREHCGCIYRKFRFDKYPPHVKDLHTYSFKTIIIMETLQEFGFIQWVDTSYRLLYDSLDAQMKVIELARKGEGLLLWTTSRYVYCQIHKGMYEFFGESADQYRWVRNVSPGNVIMYNTRFIYDCVLLPWVTCGLIKDCIAPPGSHRGPCNWTAPDNYCCHRYDLSAMALILGRLYNHSHKAYTTKMKAHTIDRGNREGVGYFESLHKQKYHLVEDIVIYQPSSQLSNISIYQKSKQKKNSV